MGYRSQLGRRRRISREVAVSKPKYIIVGAGGFARELASGLELLLATQGGQFVGFLDDTPDPLGSRASRYPPVIGTTTAFDHSTDFTLLLGIADPIPKMAVVHKIEALGGVFGTFIHPTAIVTRTAKLGRGCVLCRDSTASADATLGDFVLLNGYSGAAHDSVVGDGTTVSSFVDICGGVTIGREVFIGSHASVLPKVRVGDRARIGAGSIVMRDVASGKTVYQPAAKVLNGDE
jgi:sugar O-acyltransferase (sialic acid O-acetyltransferase NeuD family)